MREPVWIDGADCLAFHEEMLARFGGLGGMRDAGLLDSALNRPKHLFAYGTPDLFELAAAYALGVIKNHPFLDGNKRAGFMAAALFLEVNGVAFEATEEDVVIHTLALAAGKLTGRQYAAWLRRSCGRKPSKKR